MVFSTAMPRLRMTYVIRSRGIFTLNICPDPAAAVPRQDERNPQPCNRRKAIGKLSMSIRGRRSHIPNRASTVLVLLTATPFLHVLHKRCCSVVEIHQHEFSDGEVLDEAKAENRQGFSAGSLLLFKQERNLFYPMEEDGVITGGIQNKGIAIQFEGQKHSFV